ncbi:glycoside hydrolase family 27 protein [Jiulongibacter sp. NS-SX5]|uniref:glycoside hydrolase family 27 protein n=1 Tax=Jiulongibacter sp. NS-SX5 TaxID=3463854 RepID=UPI004058F4DD
MTKHTNLYWLSIIILILSSCRNPENKLNSNDIDHFQPPIMGWASWNNYHVNINEDIIKAQADALVDLGLTDFGYQFINLDDGYFGGRDEKGNLLFHPERFPSGMKSLADYIHANGLKAGIYTDAGINTCGCYYDQDTISVGNGIYGHEQQDLNLFLKEWNYDFLKVDWCGGNWLNLDEESRYTYIAEMARKIKPDVVYNVCRWQFPGQWVTNLAHSWRINGDLRANFNSILRTIDTNADLWMYCSKGHYNDMDMLQVGRGMTYEEDKAQFTMWCLMHSPLILGNDLMNTTEQTLSIITNRELIDINQSSFVYQARRVIQNDSVEVWAKPLVSSMSGEIAVAILNRSNDSQNFSFNIAEIGLDIKGGYSAKDLWTKEEFAVTTSPEISKEITPHGVVALKVNGKALPFNVFQYADK